MSETACCCTVPPGISVSDILIARVQDRDVLICPRTRPVRIGGSSTGGKVKQASTLVVRCGGRVAAEQMDNVNSLLPFTAAIWNCTGRILLLH
jgi:hypothetical protein